MKVARVSRPGSPRTGLRLWGGRPAVARTSTSAFSKQPWMKSPQRTQSVESPTYPLASCRRRDESHQPAMPPTHPTPPWTRFVSVHEFTRAASSTKTNAGFRSCGKTPARRRCAKGLDFSRAISCSKRENGASEAPAACSTSPRHQTPYSSPPSLRAIIKANVPPAYTVADYIIDFRTHPLCR
jgi:hypothetical protein